MQRHEQQEHGMKLGVQCAPTICPRFITCDQVRILKTQREMEQKAVVSQKKTPKICFLVKRYSICFRTIKSLNLIGFWIFKEHLVRRVELQPFEILDFSIL